METQDKLSKSQCEEMVAALQKELKLELEFIDDCASEVAEKRGDYLSALDWLVTTAHYWARRGFNARMEELKGKVAD